MVHDADGIRGRDDPLVASDTLAVLRGNLAPNGAVIKPPAAEPRLHRHRGPAVVFADYADMAVRLQQLAPARRTVVVLEGGYDFEALSLSTGSTLSVR